jgi:hypothetical protein
MSNHPNKETRRMRTKDKGRISFSFGVLIWTIHFNLMANNNFCCSLIRDSFIIYLYIYIYITKLTK